MKVGTDGILLGAWADVNGARQILDIGTGTGLIAIMLAQRAPEAVVHGVEIDEASCEQAAENMRAAPWSERLSVFNQPVQEFVSDSGRQYDLIVSNPPFFTGGTFSDREDRSRARHTVKLPHGDLLSAVRNHLAPGGRFSLILPYIEGLRFQELAEGYKLYCNRITEVYPRPGKIVERLLMEFGQESRELVQDSLTIYKEGKDINWTKEFRALTKDFYLKA